MNYGELEAQFGLPSGLLGAIRKVESGGGKNLLSDAGALGEFQFMPSTAKAYGINPLNPSEAAYGAAKMLADLGKQYGGNWDAVISHYNGGTKAGKAVATGNFAPSAETQAYLPKVKSAMGNSNQMSAEDAAKLLGLDSKPVAEMSASDAAKMLGIDTRPAAVQVGSALNDIPRQLGLTARYGLEGLANTAQLVTEPIRYFTDRATGFTGKTKPLGAVATDVADWIGLPKPQGATERVIADATRMGFGSMGMAGTANKLTNLPAVPAQIKAGLEALAANPTQQVAAAVGGGGAGASSREAGGSPLQQFGASLVGTVAGGMTPTAVNSVVTKVKPWLVKADPVQLEGKISLALQDSGVDWKKLPDAIKAEMLGDLKKAAAGGRELDSDAIRRLADFRMTGTTPTRGMVTLDPVQITREQNLAKIGANTADGDLQGLARVQNQNNAKLIQNVNALGANQGDLMTAGARSIGNINAVDQALGNKVSGLYQAARDMPGGDIPLNRADLVNNIYAKLGKENKLAFLPDEVSNFLDTLSAGVVKRNGQTFEVPFDAKALDNLMTVVSTAQRGAKDGNVKAALSMVRQAIDDTPIQPIKNAFGGNQVVTGQGAQFLRNQDAQAGDYMNALNEARRAAAGRFNWRESTRPIEAAVNGAEPDKFIQQFVINGNVADAKSLAMSGDRGAIKDALANWLKDKALNGAADEVGKFSQSSFNKAVKQLGEDKLKLFFNADEIKAIQANARVASYMQAQPVGSAVNNSNSGALMLGRGYDWLNAVASKVPMGKSLVVDPLRSIDISLSQRQAQNIVPGLLAKQAKQPQRLLPALVGPTAVMGGLLAAPGVDR